MILERKRTLDYYQEKTKKFFYQWLRALF